MKTVFKKCSPGILALARHRLWQLQKRGDAIKLNNKKNGNDVYLAKRLFLEYLSSSSIIVLNSICLMPVMSVHDTSIPTSEINNIEDTLGILQYIAIGNSKSMSPVSIL